MASGGTIARTLSDVPETSSRTPGDVWKSPFLVFSGRRGRHAYAPGRPARPSGTPGLRQLLGHCGGSHIIPCHIDTCMHTLRIIVSLVETQYPSSFGCCTRVRCGCIDFTLSQARPGSTAGERKLCRGPLKRELNIAVIRQ